MPQTAMIATDLAQRLVDHLIADKPVPCHDVTWHDGTSESSTTPLGLDDQATDDTAPIKDYAVVTLRDEGAMIIARLYLHGHPDGTVDFSIETHTEEDEHGDWNTETVAPVTIAAADGVDAVTAALTANWLR